MVCSSEEAFALFLRPWAEDGTGLVLSIGSGPGGSESCRILEIQPGSNSLVSVLLTLSGRKKTLDLSTASQFSYEDSRAGLVRELVERRWICFLLVEFPDGRSLLFSQPRID